MLARTGSHTNTSMLLDTIIVGPNTYMGVSRACDEATHALERPFSVARPVSARRYFLTTEGLDEILTNNANQQ